MFERSDDDLKHQPSARITAVFSWQLAFVWIAFCFGEGIAINAQDWIVIKSKSKDEDTAFQGLHGVTRTDQGILTDSKLFENALPIRYAKMQIRNKDNESSGTVIGTTSEYMEKFGLKMSNGRFLLKKDEQNRASVAVIGKRLAATLFKDADAVGRFVRVEKNYFEIIGIVDNQTPIGTIKIRQSLIIPLTTMKSRFGDRLVIRTSGRFQVLEYQLSELHLRVKKSVSTKNCRNYVERVLRSNHSKLDYEVLEDEN